jgi:hypothetical protein
MMSSTQRLAPGGERTILLERRFAYGYGIIETLATLDESGVLLIEERAGDETRIIPIVTSAGQRRFHDLLVARVATLPTLP